MATPDRRWVTSAARDGEGSLAVGSRREAQSPVQKLSRVRGSMAEDREFEALSCSSCGGQEVDHLMKASCARLTWVLSLESCMPTRRLDEGELCRTALGLEPRIMNANKE